MAKILKLLVLTVGLSLLFGCATTSSISSNDNVSEKNKVFQYPVNEEIPSEELVKVVLKKYMQINTIDNFYGADSNKTLDKKLYKHLKKSLKDRELYLKAGEHTFSFCYNSELGYSGGIPMNVTFEAGKSYEIFPIFHEGKIMRVTYGIIDLSTRKSVLPDSELSMDQRLALDYSNIILKSVSEDKTITLIGNVVENNNSADTSLVGGVIAIGKAIANKPITIEYSSDLTGTYTEKGKTYKAYIGLDAEKAQIYIKLDDEQTLSKDDFLKLSPEECDRIFKIEDVSLPGRPRVTVSCTKPKSKKLYAFFVADKK